MASMIADQMNVAGLCCISYPFHPPDSPEKTRTDHLQGLTTPALFIQGSRDPFGSPDEVSGYGLSSAIQMHWLDGADHSLKPLRKNGGTLQNNLHEVTLQLVAFARRLVLSA